MPNRQLTMPAGTTRVLEYTITYSDDWSVAEKRGLEIEEADVASAKFLLKRQLSVPDADAAVTKTTAAGVSVTDGSVTVTLSPNDTKDLQGKYYGTLRLYLTGGGVQDFEDTTYPTPVVELDITQGAVEAVS